MRKRDNSNEEKGRTTKRDTKGKGKKLYHHPRLVVYGDLNRLTMGGGGTKGDGAAGHSRLG